MEFKDIADKGTVEILYKEHEHDPYYNNPIVSRDAGFIVYPKFRKTKEVVLPEDKEFMEKVFRDLGKGSEDTKGPFWRSYKNVLHVDRKNVFDLSIPVEKLNFWICINDRAVTYPGKKEGLKDTPFFVVKNLKAEAKSVLDDMGSLALSINIVQKATYSELQNLAYFFDLGNEQAEEDVLRAELLKYTRTSPRKIPEAMKDVERFRITVLVNRSLKQGHMKFYNGMYSVVGETGAATVLGTSIDEVVTELQKSDRSELLARFMHLTKFEGGMSEAVKELLSDILNKPEPEVPGKKSRKKPMSRQQAKQAALDNKE